MPQVPQDAGYWTYLVPLIILGVVIVRNARARTLKIERLWISPTIIMVMAVLAFSHNPPPGPFGLALDMAAVALGALLGWWRGRASTFTVDPATHVVTSKVSPFGMLLILGIFGLRYLLRGAISGETSVLHVTAAEATDSFLLLAVGLVSAQRLEWWIRARRMIDEARRAGASA
ncbi:CcdC protein domain-containing protein [Phenylobacterium sp.]|uniref:CcdC protein domain-containing protein n=1 Tax=Phenylobacterium sp. TaxID=1871053 RepID=UPI0025E7D5CD|nr:CcdC protein domain-containing protein [Phenylobacterium sp.]